MRLTQSAQTYVKKELSFICKYYGIYPDLVQAGGGNISIKDGNRLYIKSSGCMLSDVEPDKNISVVNLKKVKRFPLLKDDVSEKDFLKKATISGGQPSLETFFHSLTGKYTVHLHPPMVVQALQTYKDKLVEKYKDAAFVDYYKPGLELSQHIDYTKNIIFLEKHGLIVHYDSLITLERVLQDIINYCASLLGWDMTIHSKIRSLQSNIFCHHGKQPYIMYTKVNFPNYIRQTPDCFIYTNGYYDTSVLPFIPVCYKDGDDNFIIAKNFLKCKQIEQILEEYENVTTELNDDDVEKLIDWDSEKYRKDL